jgi:Rap1a immunity proteins
MKSAVMALSVVSACWYPSLARAEQTGPITGIELYQWCTSPVAAISDGCLSFINGFMTGFSTGQQLAGYNLVMCLPSDVSSLQGKIIALKAMQDHGELLHQNANVVLGRAFLDAFRCKPGEKPTYGQKSN